MACTMVYHGNYHGTMVVCIHYHGDMHPLHGICILVSTVRICSALGLALIISGVGVVANAYEFKVLVVAAC